MKPLKNAIIYFISFWERDIKIYRDITILHIEYLHLEMEYNNILGIELN